MTNSASVCKVVVLIGGNGSNLQALIDYQSIAMSYQIVGVISHREGVYGLERAKQAHIAHQVVAHHLFEDRATFEQALCEAIDSYQPDLIVLAGFMRILSPYFIQHYARKVLNIHPSLLPRYKGLNTHQRVLENNDSVHGVSVHFVTEDLDGGPLIAQVEVPVLENDTVESLSQRVHHAEHWLYPRVVQWYADKTLTYDGNVVTLKRQLLDTEKYQLANLNLQGTSP